MNKTDQVKDEWSWREFQQRLISRALVRKDYDNLLWWVVGLIGSPTLLAGFMLDSECAAGNWALRQSYVWIAPLLVTFFGMLAYCWVRRGANIYTKIWAFVAPILIGSIATWMAIGYFDFANALTGSKEQMVVRGTVIETKSGHSRAIGNTHYLTVDFQGQKVCLSVSKAESELFKNGQVYSRVMIRGGFGYFYNWKVWAYWK